jgi:hypothetical protein
MPIRLRGENVAERVALCCAVGRKVAGAAPRINR